MRGQLPRLTQQHAGIAAGAFPLGERDDLVGGQRVGHVAPTRWAATAAVKQVATDVLGSVPVLGKLAQQALDHVKIPDL